MGQGGQSRISYGLALCLELKSSRVQQYGVRFPGRLVPRNSFSPGCMDDDENTSGGMGGEKEERNAYKQGGLVALFTGLSAIHF